MVIGNGDPLKEHENEGKGGLVGKCIKEEQKFPKVCYLKEISTAISYRRKEDFFSYDELRAITLHNVYSAFFEHDSILPSYLEVLQDILKILKEYMYAVNTGQYQFNGQTQDEILRNFCADVGVELSKRSSVVRLGRGLYGFGIFKSDDVIDISNGVIVSLMGISLDLRYS